MAQQLLEAGFAFNLAALSAPLVESGSKVITQKEDYGFVRSLSLLNTYLTTSLSPEILAIWILKKKSPRCEIKHWFDCSRLLFIAAIECQIYPINEG